MANARRGVPLSRAMTSCLADSGDELGDLWRREDGLWSVGGRTQKVSAFRDITVYELVVRGLVDVIEREKVSRLPTVVRRSREVT